MPGLVWPLATYVLDGSADVRDAMETAVANSRRYGDDWAIGVVLMFRTHMAVDSPGGMKGVDEDLAELRVLSRRVGDRWMRAQVCSASAEAAMARSRHAEAKAEYEEALRLAYEVGAYAETPFLLARLAEIAYRAGDRRAARRLLDEASEAAERHAVVDTAAFVLLTRAQMALDEKDTARARELWEKAREETGRGTPPPQFLVMLMAVDAGVTAAESGPAHGLHKLVDAVREAVEKRCADMVVATLLDGTVGLLAELGDHARVVRLLALADTWRDGQPRLMPEGARAEAAGEAARTALGAERYEREYARGAALTPDALFTEFTETLRRHPAR
jgi:ATP/maltotriose-dependent transcriptional regulator MalT